MNTLNENRKCSTHGDVFYAVRVIANIPPPLRGLGEEVADQDFGAVEIGEEGGTDGNLDSASSKAATEADASAQQQDRSIIDPNEIDLESEIIDPNGNGLENEVIPNESGGGSLGEAP